MSNLQTGISYYKEGKFEEALTVFNELMEQSPKEPAHLLYRGRILSRLGRLENALSDFDQLALLDAYNPDFISDRAVVLHLLKRNEEALSEMGRALNLDPQNPYRYSSRAFLKDRIGDLKGAIEDYEKAIELDPEDAVAYNNKGIVEEKLGYKERSQNSYHTADKLVGGEKSQGDSTPPEPQKKQYSDFNKSISGEEKMEPIPDSGQKKVSFSDYMQVIKKVFSDKGTWNEFISFIWSKFKRS
ncbi:tetratricopeptide repeat protein [Echinicola jeungdonensis]|uniref:Tetratricopeptide repeat protein n=1 Tax=Echinicola jeungdonensis TaxID=709343 RepID=A0ABV5J6Z0_9BACT|nr:tetratricopeptide repeat protein [Echinicola jeungdonensis]MDN3670884.1 tetratricopeptide repeat protein [Echinicola jeungdonensis]